MKTLLYPFCRSITSDEEIFDETGDSVKATISEKKLSALNSISAVTGTVSNSHFEGITATNESLGRVSVKAGENNLTISISAKNDDLSLYVKKMGESEYTGYQLTKDAASGELTATIPFNAADLAEMFIEGIQGGKTVYNTYYLDRSESTDKGYIYGSVDGCVEAYMNTNKEMTFTLLADNTSYTNGTFVSVNQATLITADDETAITGGEIYSVASKMADIDYTTLHWFKYSEGMWTQLDTDYSTEENLNIGARADLNGAGLYVLMAEKASEDPAEAVQNLNYTQAKDRDAVVTLTFDDPNTTSAYYNVYYSDDPITSTTSENVAVRTFQANSTSLTIDLLERGRKVHAAVEVVLEDGRRSPLSYIDLVGGEADSDNDGIPDWYCDKYELWPKDGETKDIANSDDDNDGLTNLEEYKGGSDPKDPNDPVVQKENIAVKSVSMSDSMTLNIGETDTLTASINPSDATNTNLIWSVDDTSIATITFDGNICKVTAVSEGETTVTVVTEDGGYASNCKVTVNSKPRKDITKARVFLSTNKVPYIGEEVTPYVSVTYHGRPLIEGKDYELSYENAVNPGKATVKITGIGNFGGTVTRDYIITPAKVKLNEVKSETAGTLYVSWINDGMADGYEILLHSSRSRGYSSTISRFTIDGTESETTINDLIAGNRYTVYVRAYKLIDGTPVYGKFGASKSVTIKNDDYGYGFGNRFGWGFGFGHRFGYGFGYNPYFNYGSYGYNNYYSRPYATTFRSRRTISPFYFWF